MSSVGQTMTVDRTRLVTSSVRPVVLCAGQTPVLETPPVGVSTINQTAPVTQGQGAMVSLHVYDVRESLSTATKFI